VQARGQRVVLAATRARQDRCVQAAIVARDAEGGSQCRDHCGHDKQECNAGKRFAAPESRKTYELMR
jgi:hypothetical protein